MSKLEKGTERGTCPICKGLDFYAIIEEVDIGVGTQTLITGGECKTCGFIPNCDYCGTWDDSKHPEWCKRRT